MTDLVGTRAPSPVSERAAALVADRRPRAELVGRQLAEMAGDPEAFVAGLRAGFIDLGDPAYIEGQRRVAPGIGPVLGVRWPLMEAIKRGFREETRRERTTAWLFLVDRLFREPEQEFRWFAFGLLERLVIDDPERSWQLLRRASRDAADGNRAWVVRDALPKLAEDRAARIRDRLAGIRRKPGVPSTSRASRAASGFGDALSGVVMPEPPLT